MWKVSWLYHKVHKMLIFWCYATLLYQKIKVKVVLRMWRKFGAFVTCVHISFKFGFKQPN